MAEERPIFAPTSMSSALASLMAAAFCSSASAIASKQPFLSAVASRDRSREAALACLANWVICSVNVMGGH